MKFTILFLNIDDACMKTIDACYLYVLCKYYISYYILTEYLHTKKYVNSEVRPAIKV